MNLLKAAALAFALTAATPALAESSAGVLRAQALLEAGKTDEAAAALEQAIARDRSDVEALVLLSELYAYSEMYDEALAQAQAAVAIAPSDPSALKARGHAWMLKEDYPNAKADFDAVLAGGPDAAAFMSRGLVRAGMEDDKGAVADLEAAAALLPDAGEPLFSLAALHVSQNRHEESLKYVELGLAREPDVRAALELRADLLFILGRADDAVSAREDIVERYPKDLEARLQLADTYYATGRDDEALKAYTAASKIDGRSARAWAGKGRLLADEGKHRAALRDYDRAILIDPINAELLADRGESRAAVDDNRARSDFDSALKIDPASAYALVSRANYNFAQEDFGAALTDYDAAIEVEPENIYALVGRADTLVALGRYDRALRDVNRAIDMDPYPILYRMKGWIYVEMEDHLQAVANFDEAIRLDPEDSLALIYRSRAKAALGDTAGAEADRAQALKLNPDVEAEADV